MTVLLQTKLCIKPSLYKLIGKKHHSSIINFNIAKYLNKNHKEYFVNHKKVCIFVFLF